MRLVSRSVSKFVGYEQVEFHEVEYSWGKAALNNFGNNLAAMT
jgi:hypothetical protein